MYSILLSAGWPIWPLLIISIIGLAIVLERSWYLRQIHIFPKGCLESAFSLCNQLLKENKPSDTQISDLAKLSPASPLFACVLKEKLNSNSSATAEARQHIALRPLQLQRRR
jgi:biopolymer transport protein ExbB